MLVARYVYSYYVSSDVSTSTYCMLQHVNVLVGKCGNWQTGPKFVVILALHNIKSECVKLIKVLTNNLIVGRISDIGKD